MMFLTIGLIACSQKNAPDVVKKEFSQKFPGAKSVRWDSENTNEWEAEFKIGGKVMSACFDSTGKWLESETEINQKDLPPAVLLTLKNEFSDYKIKEITTVENPEMKGFEFALKNKETEMTVIIGADGSVLKKEEADENKEEVGEKDERSENEATEAGARKEAKVPEKITNAFNLKYAGAISVIWGSEEANEWEAEFTLAGKKMSACFDSSAVWTVTETVISEKEIPEAVLKTLKTEFSGYKKSLIEIYESPDIKGFEMILKKGEKSVEVIFDNSGKVVKKTDTGEENEKEEKEK
jgi:hypothetical protein